MGTVWVHQRKVMIQHVPKVVIHQIQYVIKVLRHQMSQYSMWQKFRYSTVCNISFNTLWEIVPFHYYKAAGIRQISNMPATRTPVRESGIIGLTFKSPNSGHLDGYPFEWFEMSFGIFFDVQF